jgi:hypothetical protein
MSSLAILAQVSAEALLLKSSLAILAQVSAEALLLKSSLTILVLTILVQAIHVVTILVQASVTNGGFSKRWHSIKELQFYPAALAFWGFGGCGMGGEFRLSLWATREF